MLHVQNLCFGKLCFGFDIELIEIKTLTHTTNKKRLKAALIAAVSEFFHGSKTLRLLKDISSSTE